MGTTANGKFPYPEGGDPVNVHGDIKRLADQVESAIRGSAVYLGNGTGDRLYVRGRRMSVGQGSWASLGNGGGEDVLLEDNTSHPDGSRGAMISLRAGIGGMSGSSPGTSGMSVQIFRNNDPGTVVRINGIRTIGSAASNVRCNSAGELARETSSRRYKTAIKTLSDADCDKILQLKPITYRIKTAHPQDGDDGTVDHPGLIAEDVASVDPLYVIYDDAGQPDGLMYDRLVAPLIGVVKRQQKTIEALEARVAALEAP